MRPSAKLGVLAAFVVSQALPACEKSEGDRPLQPPDRAAPGSKKELPGAGVPDSQIVVLEPSGNISRTMITVSGGTPSFQSTKLGTAPGAKRLLGMTADETTVIVGAENKVFLVGAGATKEIQSGTHTTLTPNSTHILWETSRQRFSGGGLVWDHTIWGLHLVDGAEPRALGMGAIVGFDHDGTLVSETQSRDVGPAGGTRNHKVHYHRVKIPSSKPSADPKPQPSGIGSATPRKNPGVFLADNPPLHRGRAHPLGGCTLTLDGRELGKTACHSPMVVTDKHIAWLEPRRADLMAVVTSRDGRLQAEIVVGNLLNAKQSGGLAMTPDAKTLFVTSPEGAVRRHTLSTGTVEELGTGHTLRMSQDGQWVAWLNGTDLEVRTVQTLSKLSRAGVKDFMFATRN